MIKDPELRQLYKFSSQERLEKLQTNLLALRKNPNNEIYLNELIQELKTLRADSQIVELDIIGKIANNFQQIITKIQKKEIIYNSELYEIFYETITVISQLVNEAVSESPSKVDWQKIVNKLEEILVEENAKAKPEIIEKVIPEKAEKSQETTELNNQNNQNKSQSFLIQDEELRVIYETSSTENLDKLEAGLIKLASNPEDLECIEELSIKAHSLKGDSRIVEVESIEIITHTIEKIFKKILKNELKLTSQLREQIQVTLNPIRKLLEQAVKGIPHNIDTLTIVDGLTQAITQQISEDLSNETDKDLLHNQENQEINLSETEANLNLEEIESQSIYIEDEELREIYKISSQEHLEKIETNLLNIEKDPNDIPSLDKLLRELHSIKGDSRIIGINSVEKISHAMEDILIKVKNGQRNFTYQISELLYNSLDAMKELIQEAVTGFPHNRDLSTILQLLDQEITGEKPERELENNINQDLKLLLEDDKLVLEQIKTESIFIEDEELRQNYKISSTEHLEELETDLLNLEKDSQNIAFLEKLLREVHSIKGDARTIGIDIIETIAHGMEDVLIQVKDNDITLTPQISDRLYNALDAIKTLAKEAITGIPHNLNLQEILHQLKIGKSKPEKIIKPNKNTGKTNNKSFNQQVALSPPTPLNEPYKIDTIRVQTKNLDNLIIQTGELTVNKIRIANLASEIDRIAFLWQQCKSHYYQMSIINSTENLINNPLSEKLEKAIDNLKISAVETTTRLDLIAEELEEKIRGLRMLPLSTLFNFFPRMVRDLAKEKDKQIELKFSGGDTVADKQLIEELKDPLMHMIRNSIDHGIETKEERRVSGKPPLAQIWLRGYQNGNNIIIEIQDDGKGLNLQKIKETAIKRGLHNQQELDTMSVNQIQSLIFRPGFSTQSFITEVSGRGIGLDVVRANIEQLKGNIDVESVKGKGCKFIITIGITLATATVGLLSVQGIIFALPVEFIQTFLFIQEQDIFTIEGRKTFSFNNKPISLVNLADLLELSNSVKYPIKNNSVQNQDLEENILEDSHRQACIVMNIGQESFGLLVDRVLDTLDVVLKPQSKILKRVRNVTGAAILGSGEVCMILNPQDLFKSMQKQIISSVVTTQASEQKVKTKPVLLLAEDSITTRTQEKRILEAAGYEVVTAVDGLDAFNKLQTRPFDGLVSDVQMPNLDGLQLTAKVRQSKEYNELPIILVTTLSSDEDRKRGAEAGANAYIIKGKFNQDVLLETLSKLV